MIRASLSPSAILRFSPEEIAGAEPREWPVYSVLVPMYKEPETLKQMVAALTAMDYPADKKDVQILLEADDDLTLNAARALTLPPGFRVTEIPPSFPRTKPKACNIGLYLAQGDYLVIYDAEDLPERDQLRKAAKSAVCKINIDSDGRLVMTAAIRKVFAEKPAEFDPRKYLGPARAALKELYKHKCKNVLGSAGHAWE